MMINTNISASKSLVLFGKSDLPWEIKTNFNDKITKTKLSDI